MEILDVRYDQMPSIKQVTCKGDYDKVQKFLYEKDGILITPWSDLDIQQKGNIVVFIEDWICKIEILEKGKRKIYKYSFQAGFVCDKGSIPPKLRSFVDNDDPQLLVGFYVHDSNYACHFLPRLESDELLRDMGDFRGASWWKKFKVYRVLRIAGGSAYESEETGINVQKKWVSFKEIEL